MKKQSVFILFLCLFTTNWATAQDQARRGHHPKGHPEAVTEEMKAALQLTDDQRVQLEALEAETATAIETIRQDKKVLRSSMRELQETHQAKLAEILTDDQLVSLRSLRQAEGDRRRAQYEAIDHRALKKEIRAYQDEHITPVMSAQRLKLEENLSAEEKASLISIRADLDLARQKRDQEQLERKNRSEGSQNVRRGKRDRLEERGGQLRRQFPEHYETLTAIVAKYDQQITGLLADVAPQREQWKADEKAIRDKYIPEDLRRDKHHAAERDADPQLIEKRTQGAKILFLLRKVD